MTKYLEQLYQLLATINTENLYPDKEFVQKLLLVADGKKTVEKLLQELREENYYYILNSKKAFIMKLIFKPNVDMELMRRNIQEMCDENSCSIIEQTENTIIYGDDSLTNFAVAYVHISYDEEIKHNLIDAIWSDHEGVSSCLDDILKPIDD